MPNTLTTTAIYPLPGFPMRPAMGLTLTAANVIRLVRKAERIGFMVQPKLNGDRVILRKIDGKVEAWNRRGSRYSFSVNADANWQGLPDDTLLDGEGWQCKFYPFEALRIGGQDLTGACVTVRAAAAKDLCRKLGNGWLFDRPADAWLRLCRENLPTWEGIVAKKTGTPYTPTKKMFHDSDGWLKLKWV